MAQHDYVLDNASGAVFRADANSLAQAIATQNSGASAPGTTYPYMSWPDTTNGLLKQRNGANTAWVTIGPLDTASWGLLKASNNLSDLASAATARTNLGVVIGTDVLAPNGSGASLAGVSLPGLQTIWVPAGAMTARTTNGAAPGTVESTTNKVMTKSLDFDTATQEFAQFNVRFPKSWDEGTVTFAPVWTAASGSGGVVFGLAGVALSDDDAIDTAYGTAQTSTDTLITANDIHVGPTSSSITIAGTPAVGDWVSFQINRTVSDGSDTLGVDARLLGIALLFTTNAGNDA
jgi:hypothetical protein